MRILFFLFPFLCFLSCGEEAAEPFDFASQQVYFPLELNRELIYEQDSIVLFGSVRGAVYDTARSQVRERLVEEFVGADGNTQYRGERWQRATERDPWTFVISYLVTRTDRNATRTEDNLTFTKLTFPIRSGRSWDGHAAFNERTQFPVGGEILDIYNNWEYRYAGEALDTSYNGIELEDTWLVEQADIDNLIDLRRAFERYAPNIGLVERFVDARHTQCQDCCGGDTAPCGGLPWDEKAEKGFILHQRLIAVE